MASIMLEIPDDVRECQRAPEHVGGQTAKWRQAANALPRVAQTLQRHRFSPQTYGLEGLGDAIKRTIQNGLF